LRKITLFFLLLISCNLNVESEKNVIAKVGENFFTYDDLIEKIPKNIQRLDSTLIVNSIIEKWALNELLINNAEINLSEFEKKRIKKNSNEYYNSLLVNSYKNKIAAFNSDSLVNENEILEYYKLNFTNFVLYEDVVRARYIRLNKNNFNLNEIKRRFRRFNQDDLIFFDSISLQLLNYSFNDSIWINKDLFFNKIGFLDDEEIDRIVKKSLYIAKEDSLDVYLIKVNGFKGINEEAPLNYIYKRIEELIINKKKVDFIKNFDREIIENAKQKKIFKIFN
jgi:hypothetical protein|tara:strand:- start:880 stop:1719 length:840 start_codon:yes stop_codon:yes gene_type:complete